MLLTKFGSFGHAVSEKILFLKSSNQKKELHVAAMFDNGSQRNEHSLEDLS
jgi:hypothetical protein